MARTHAPLNKMWKPFLGMPTQVPGALSIPRDPVQFLLEGTSTQGRHHLGLFCLLKTEAGVGWMCSWTQFFPDRLRAHPDFSSPLCLYLQTTKSFQKPLEQWLLPFLWLLPLLCFAHQDGSIYFLQTPLVVPSPMLSAIIFISFCHFFFFTGVINVNTGFFLSFNLTASQMW